MLSVLSGHLNTIYALVINDPTCLTVVLKVRFRYLYDVVLIELEYWHVLLLLDSLR